jgi:hypothetical protein
VKHDPSGLPLSRGVRFTENTAEIKVGDGLWVGASEAPTTFKIYAVDPATSQVAFYGVMKELDKPLIIALRLKVIRGEITEIEHVLARNMRPDRMQNLITPRPALLADVSDSDKTSREEMLSAADSYFEAIEHGQGSLAPFAEDRPARLSRSGQGRSTTSRRWVRRSLHVRLKPGSDSLYNLWGLQRRTLRGRARSAGHRAPDASPDRDWRHKMNRRRSHRRGLPR